MTTAHPNPVHTYFGLSYANYLVLHRTLLQSMPDAWQQRFVDCLNEFDEAFRSVPRPEAFNVTPAEDRYLNELTDAELQAIGYRATDTDETTVYHDEHGNLVDSDEASSYHVLVPTTDQVPDYDRGRAIVAPELPAQIGGDQ